MIPIKEARKPSYAIESMVHTVHVPADYKGPETVSLSGEISNEARVLRTHDRGSIPVAALDGRIVLYETLLQLERVPGLEFTVVNYSDAEAAKLARDANPLILKADGTNTQVRLGKDPMGRPGMGTR